MVDGQTTDGQQTDDGACLYYKFTNEPKAQVTSGELKRLSLQIMHIFKTETLKN